MTVLGQMLGWAQPHIDARIDELLSDWFESTTGEMIHVDGGYHVNYIHPALSGVLDDHVLRRADFVGIVADAGRSVFQ